MSKLLAPPYVDKARAAVLNRITTHFDRLYELSAPKHGQKNPITSKDAILEKYQSIHDSASKAYALEGITRFVLPEPYEPANPSIPIDKLKKIQVRDLIVGKRHRGTHIKIKIARRAHRHEFAVDAVFEDEGGSFGILRVYFLDDDSEPEDHLPCSQLVIIRDPYLWDGGNGVMLVRVDHPSDMQLLHTWDAATEKLVPAIWRSSVPFGMMSAAHLVGLADLYYQGGEYLAALQKYDWAEQRVLRNRGIEIQKDVLCRLYLGRAEINVRLQRYYLTAKDTDAVLKISPSDTEAMHIRALRFYYTGKYEACQEEVRKLLEKHPKQVVYANLGRRASERFEEVKFGRYNWRNIRHRASLLYLDLDHADFTHPVKLKKTPKGRRIFTARDVKRGDLLMVVKALAIIPFEDLNLCVQLAPRNGSFECEYGCSAFFDLEILERIKREGPEWYEKTFCLMDDGGYSTPPYRNTDGTKVIDAFHIEAVRRRNSIIVSNVPLLQHRATGYMPGAPTHLPRVMTYNCGIWYLPSFLRHSCIPNAHRAIIGDMFVVRAGRDLPKDTKLNVNCSTPSNWEYLMTDFACTCPIHNHDIKSSEGPNDKEKSKESIWRDFNTSCQFIEAAKSNPERWTKINLLELLPAMSATLDKIQPTLPSPSLFPQIQLAHRYRYIAAAYFSAGQRRHSRCAYYKVLDCLGVEYMVFDELDEVVWTNHGQCTEDLLHTYCDLSALTSSPGIKRCWQEAAVDVYEILFGERSSFETVIQHMPFIEAQDQCPCVGADNLKDTEEVSLKKRMGIDIKKEEELAKTADGLAMMQLMENGAARSWDAMLEKDDLEYELGAEKMTELIRRREREREKRLRRERPEEEEKRQKSDKENEREKERKR